MCERKRMAQGRHHHHPSAVIVSELIRLEVSHRDGKSLVTLERL